MHDTLPPRWLDDKKILESLFCEDFLTAYPMIAINGTLFTVEGRVSDEMWVRREIYRWLRPVMPSGLAKRSQTLLDAIRLDCYQPNLPLQRDRIHVANGTLFLDGTFAETKEFCRNRLPVGYNREAPNPERWLLFLAELLHPEDIPTLQEFMGYCLIPSTKGQKMLLITGKGGEGKSRIGLVLRSLLGDNMNTGSLSKVETSPFARADLEHQLLMVDDDMKLEALPQTHYLKSIITAELPMDLERKGKQSYQGQLYVRFLGLGNGNLQSLYDRSVGFFRRQILLTTKDRDPERKDDPYLGEKLQSEVEGILLWCLTGLHRLIAQNYQFTISQRAQENLEVSMADGCNVADFMTSEGYIKLDWTGEASSRDLYRAYTNWCEDNAMKPLSQRSFSNHLNENTAKYGLDYNNNIYIGGKRRVRGYHGVQIIDEFL
ncbi:DNA primase family protein [Chakrabartyella piscis]|uniref:DNA primase family protein n=1 Tax=Chakrabartyella piscis TaxID=2918914 RepID=UPI0029585797|nr:DUF5906 domain-containing protein [Chakrabartyella piscis]